MSYAQTFHVVDESVLNSKEKFYTEHEEYYFLPIPSNIDTQSVAANNFSNNTNVQSEKSVAVKGPFVIYEIEQNNQKYYVAKHQQRGKLPVVYNKRTQQFGVVQGYIIVTPHSFSTINEIAEDYPMSIEKSFSKLNVVFFKVNESTQILQIYQKLLADGRVLAAQIEILENIAVTH